MTALRALDESPANEWRRTGRSLAKRTWGHRRQKKEDAKKGHPCSHRLRPTRPVAPEGSECGLYLSVELRRH